VRRGRGAEIPRKLGGKKRGKPDLVSISGSNKLRALAGPDVVGEEKKRKTKEEINASERAQN